MADNANVTAGDGSIIVATDKIGGVDYQRVKLTHGADGTASDASATAPVPGYTPGGLQAIPATAFNRPANTTAYTAGDLVADTVTAGSVAVVAIPNAVRAAGEFLRVERVRLRKSGTGLTNASFRVYLCRALPAFSVGDNGVLNTAGALAIDDVVYVVGWFDVVMDRSATAGARGVAAPNVGAAVTLSPSSGTTLYAIIEALGAYTPVSAETFNMTLEGQWG